MTKKMMLGWVAFVATGLALVAGSANADAGDSDDVLTSNGKTDTSVLCCRVPSDGSGVICKQVPKLPCPWGWK